MEHPDAGLRLLDWKGAPTMRTALLLSVALCVPASTAEWTWTWTPAAGEKQPQAAFTTFKYAKTWAYAIELDDGPAWVRSFAVPFLAEYGFTDAPPGVAGGRRLPFVGGAAIIASVTGYNDHHLSWEDCAALVDAGWGIINHSVDHRARSWGDPPVPLSDAEVVADAFWSQTLYAAHLPGGRAPTAVVYANGYTDYNRHGALAALGVAIGTRVGGGSTIDVTSPGVQWLDIPRSYLDEPNWSGQHGSAPMAAFPGADRDGPSANSLVIDFTHNIDRDPASANHLRWRERLGTIARHWGAEGADTLWCAPTGEIADYVHASRKASIRIGRGTVTISLPDDIPGSALTVRLEGIGAKAALTPPEGGAVYRQGTSVVLTTPIIGHMGAAAPAPKVTKLYEGPAVSVEFAKPARIAGITLGMFGEPTAGSSYRLAARTANGEQVIAERMLEQKWIVGSHLCPILPGSPAILATGVTVVPVPEMKQMTVWAVAE